MMVAAHGGDLDAAGALGFATCYVPRPDEEGLGKGPWPGPKTRQADLVVRDFRELADRLDC